MNAPPLRCLHYLPHVNLTGGGVTRACLDMCRLLAARGAGITLLTGDPLDAPADWPRIGPDETPAIDGLPRVAVVNHADTSRRLDPPSLDAARRLVASHDLVHLHGVWTVSNLDLARLARDTGKPYGVTVHGMLNDWSMSQRRLKKQVFLRTVGRRHLRRAAFVQCTARQEADQAESRMGGVRAEILPYLFDLQPFDPPPGPDLARGKFPAMSADRPTVLFLSRLHEMKGVEHVIDAAAMLRDRGIDAAFPLAGPGDETYISGLKARAARLGVEDRVHFLGMVGGELKMSLYAAADVFALPTHRENFGLVLPEAMACRTPAVTTRGVDIWRDIEGAGATILDPDRPVAAALADALGALLADPDDLALRGERGREWVFTALHPDRLAPRYADLYRRAVGA